MNIVGLGMDATEIGRIAETFERYGDRFLRRVFTEGEIAYARSAPALTAERLAARFAAKEAAKKALELEGVAWRDLEVARSPNGAPHLVLHGAARAAAGTKSFALSMSHEGDHATAVVIAHD